jgi:hypothetical protein
VVANAFAPETAPLLRPGSCLGVSALSPDCLSSKVGPARRSRLTVSRPFLRVVLPEYKGPSNAQKFGER